MRIAVSKAHWAFSLGMRIDFLCSFRHLLFTLTIGAQNPEQEKTEDTESRSGNQDT